MAQSFVGIDLGTHEVKFAVVQPGLRGATALELFAEPVAGGADGDDSLAAALEVAMAVIRNRGLARAGLCFALPGGAASYRLLGFPFTDARRIAQAVAFEAEGQFAAPLDQLAYDHAVIPAGRDGRGRALVVAAPAARRDAVVAAARAAGIEPRVVTVGSVAAATIVEFAAPPVEGGERPAVSLLVDVGHRTCELIAVGDKGPIAARSVRRGGLQITRAIAAAYQLDLDQAELAKQRSGFAAHGGNRAGLSAEQLRSGEVVARALEPLAREIEHTCIWLRSTWGLEVTRVVLAGGGARLQGADAYFAERLGLPVEPVSAAHVPAKLVRGLEGRDVVAHLPALGAALAGARRATIQLYDPVSAGVGAGWLAQQTPTMLGLGLAMLALAALDTVAQVRAARRDVEVRAAELDSATREVFGEAVAAADVKARLDEAEGADLGDLLPRRGAVELLAILAEKASPVDKPAVSAPPPAAASGDEPAGEGDGAAAPAEGEGAGAAGGDGSEDPASPTGAGEADPAAAADGAASDALAPVPEGTVGIMRSDELVFDMIDIRERKLEVRAFATRSSAQDRLAAALQGLGCLTNISKGKVRDQNDRKVFTMSMDNACFTAPMGDEEAES